MIHPIPPIGYAVIGGMFVLGVTRFVQVIRHEIQVREFNRMLKQLDKYYAENPCEDDGGEGVKITKKP